MNYETTITRADDGRIEWITLLAFQGTYDELRIGAFRQDDGWKVQDNVADGMNEHRFTMSSAIHAIHERMVELLSDNPQAATGGEFPIAGDAS